MVGSKAAFLLLALLIGCASPTTTTRDASAIGRERRSATSAPLETHDAQQPAAALEPTARATRPPLLVGSDLDNRPFAWVDAAGTARGRDVEMMEALATHIGRTITWRRMPFEDLLGAVERSEVDAVCATVGITPERALRVTFTRPYFLTDIAVVVRAGDGEPRSLSELSGRIVAAGAGTTSERAARLRLQSSVLELSGGKGTTSTLERLLLGDIDAAVTDGPAADALVASSDGTLVRLSTPLDSERYALALPLSSVVLRTQLNQALRAIEQDGTMIELDTRHGLLLNRH